MTKALIPLAAGVEELEAVATIDVLRRAKWEVTVAAIGELTVTAARGVRLAADTTWDQIEPDSFDVIALPGGAVGTQALAADTRLLAALRGFDARAKPLAAICAAPLVLQASGVLRSRRFTCFPGVRERFECGRYCDQPVVEDENLVTSQGAGTSVLFALAIIGRIAGEAARRAVAEGMVFRG
jgi:4-methyl-5(b-hydroxyethyl)-thiazole monophosphate biosynthesis